MTSTTALPRALGYDDLPALLTLLRSDAKHDPSAASTLDVHWVLYDRVLNVTPATADDPERDRLLLSKGHGPASYYAVLAAKGFIPVEALAGFAAFDSPPRAWSACWATANSLRAPIMRRSRSPDDSASIG